MNKKNVAFAFAALSLALVSCSHPSDGSASSSTETDLSSNSSSDQSSTLPAEDHNPLKQAAYDFISTASKSVNYTYGLKGEGGAIVSKAIITPNYIAYPESGSATVALPSYTGEGKILYSAEKIDGAYGITSALTYTDPTTGEVSGYTSISELDYLDLLLRYGLSADSFAYQSGYLLVEDANLVTILATMFGLSSYIDYIMRVSISYDETAGKMEVGFVSNFKDDGTATQVLDATIGVITGVGTSVDEEVEGFVFNFALPGDSLPESALGYLDADQITYKAELKMFLDGNLYSDLSDMTMSIDYATKKAKIVDRLTGYEDTSYYLTDGNDVVYETYIGPDDKLKESTTDTPFADFAPSLAPLIDREAFLRTGENTYSYFGYLYDPLVKGLTRYEVGMGVVTSMTAKTDGQGRLTEITARSRDVLLIGTGTFHYEMKLTFMDYEQIGDVDVYKDEEDVTIKNAFAHFNSADGYELTAYRVDQPSLTKKVTVMGNVALYDTISIDQTPGSGNEQIHIYDGYAFYEGGVAPFKVGEDGKAAYYDEPETGFASIDDFLTYDDLDPKAFYLDGDTIKARHGVKGLADTLFYGPNGDLMIESSLRFNLDVNSGTIASYAYDTAGLGEEVVEVSYRGVNFPSNIDFSSLNSVFVPPTTWREGAPNVYEALCAISWVGEEYADEVPFLYDAVLNDYWYLGNYVPEDGIRPYIELNIVNNYFLTGNPYNVDYMNDYIDLLLEKGFTVGVTEGVDPNVYSPYARYGKEGLPFVIQVNSLGANGMPQISIKDAFYFPFIPQGE